MRHWWLLLVFGALLLDPLGLTVSSATQGTVRLAASHQETAPASASPAAQAPQQVVARTCVGCHSHRAKAGNLSLEGFTVDNAAADRETAEKMIRKLRAGQIVSLREVREEKK